MSWLCSCGIWNSGLNIECAAVLTRKTTNHLQISNNNPDFVTAVAIKQGLGVRMTAEQSEDLFKKYYNETRIQVAAMTYSELQEHIETLEKIAFEAKTRVVAAKDHDREEKAKLSVSQKAWISTRQSDNQDVNSTAVVRDAQAVVTQRRARMSKMDKLAAQLEAAGIEPEIRKQMIADMEARMTSNAQKVVTFKSNKPKIENTAIAIVETKTEKVPFDASSLVFGKKE